MLGIGRSRMGQWMDCTLSARGNPSADEKRATRGLRDGRTPRGHPEGSTVVDDGNDSIVPMKAPYGRAGGLPTYTLV
jgi:hypothetical protein